jgi:transcriptional/translational regulatory protein YebC/TACO1
MQKENIDRAVAKGKAAEGAALASVLYETYGPGGTAILITAVTDNPNRTTPEIRHLLSKAGYQLGVTGSASWAFQKNGHGYIPTTPLTLSDDDDDVQDIFTTADEPTDQSE